MAPPARPQPAHYHYHVYDYDGSQPYTTLGPSGRYNFYSLVKDLEDLANTAQSKQIPDVALGRVGWQVPDQDGTRRDVKVLSLGPTDAPVVLLTGGIHAREWLAVEMTYLIAEYLIRNYRKVPSGEFQEAINLLVNQRRIDIIPMLNPNGNYYCIHSVDEFARKWRKNRAALPGTAAAWVSALMPNGRVTKPFRDVIDLNGSTFPENGARYDVPILYERRTFDTIKIRADQGQIIGVDPNRNFPTNGWGHETIRGKKESGELIFDTAGNPDGVGDDYFGLDRGSEVETKNIVAYLGNLRGMAGGKGMTCIDYHSCYKAILYPPEAAKAGKVDGAYRQLGRLVQTLIATDLAPSGPPDYRLGTPPEVMGYDAAGSIIDYVALSGNHARAFTIELDPDTNEKDTVFDGPNFWPQETKIQGYFEKNIRAALAVIAAAGPRRSRWFGRRAVGPSERAFLSWNVFGKGNRLPDES
jgi:Zinc carboxypeptidase